MPIIVPSELTGGLGGNVNGFYFSMHPKELYAFPTTYTPKAADLNFSLISAISSSASGRMGHPGIAPLTSDQKIARTNITVGHPTQLKVALAFDKTGDTGKNKLTAPAYPPPPQVMLDEPVAPVLTVDYIYRFYQFTRPTAFASTDPDVANMYVAIYRDDDTPVKPEELTNFSFNYGSTTLALKDMTPAPSGVSLAGVPSGSATYMVRLPAIANPQADTQFDLSLQDITPSAIGLKGAQGAGSIIGVADSASEPVVVNVKARMTTLVVTRADGKPNWIRYSSLLDPTDTHNYTTGMDKDLTISISRADGALFSKSDIDIPGSKLKMNSLVAGSGTDGVGSVKFTLGTTSLPSSPALFRNKNAIPSNKEVMYLLEPLATTIPVPALWDKPQVQLQLYIVPSTNAQKGDKDKDPIQLPLNSSNTFSNTSANVGRVLLFADWLGALPYDGSPSNSQTTTVPTTGGSSSNVKGF